jgi:hypothetical protein
MKNIHISEIKPSFIKSLKLQIGEEADYDQVIARRLWKDKTQAAINSDRILRETSEICRRRIQH